MGLFDSLFSSKQSNTESNSYNPLSDYEAWVAILYAAMSSDGEASDVEIEVLARSLLHKNKFSDIDIIPLYKNVMLAREKYGTVHVIERASPLIKEQDRPTVLALTAELVLSDGILQEKEKEVLEFITEKLLIDAGLASRIVEVMLIKNTDNRILA